MHNGNMTIPTYEKEHTWSQKTVGGTSTGQQCIICHQLQLKSKRFSSGSKQGWEKIEPCIQGRSHHQFIPFFKNSGVVQWCTDCYIVRGYGKKFGSNKYAGFEKVSEVCGPLDENLKVYVEKELIGCDLHEEGRKERSSSQDQESIDEGLVDDFTGAYSGLQIQQPAGKRDFRADFPHFGGVDPNLIEEALSHPSWSSENGKNYLRLAVLGDAMLDLYVIETIYNKHPGMDNGEITIEKSKIVSNHALGQFAIPYLPYVRTRAVIFRDSKVACDVMEALVGAYYSQFGYKMTCELCRKLGIAAHI
uniref:Dicer n=1 Tax=Sphaeroforma sirkka TaxID=1618205 RepID=A0A383QRX9_9EUKA|nr:Dicer [Sphaeroforma sirkka]